MFVVLVGKMTSFETIRLHIVKDYKISNGGVKLAHFLLLTHLLNPCRLHLGRAYIYNECLNKRKHCLHVHKILCTLQV